MVQVSWTGKWVRNATAALTQELNAPAAPEGNPQQN